MSETHSHEHRVNLLDPTQPDLPLVSVIVPVRNEQGFIGRCILALAAQDYPHDMLEVFVVDGGSEDATEYEAQHAAEEGNLTIFFVPNPRRTTASGFNLGLSLAHGQVIVKVDGHTRVEPEFTSASVKALAESGADAVGGPIQTRGFGVVGRAIALAMSSPFGVGDAAFRYSDREQWTDSVPFGAYRREVFHNLGGFAEDIERGEDDEFNYRLRQSGGRILLTPSIRSTYFSRASLQELARQYWGYGLAKAAVLQRHPGRLRPRHLVPSALVLSVVGGAFLGLFSRRFALLAGLAATSYAVANGLASLKTAGKQNRQELRYLPLAFACMHLPAGAGMIVGFLRGLRRRGNGDGA